MLKQRSKKFFIFFRKSVDILLGMCYYILVREITLKREENKTMDERFWEITSEEVYGEEITLTEDDEWVEF